MKLYPAKRSKWRRFLVIEKHVLTFGKEKEIWVELRKGLGLWAWSQEYGARNMETGKVKSWGLEVNDRVPFV